MARKQYTAEQIIGKLREVEVLLSQGKTQEQAIRAIGVTGNTYCRSRWDGNQNGLFLICISS